MSLANCQLRHVHKPQNEDNGYDHLFHIQRLNGPPLILAATSQELKEEWMNVIDTAIQQSSQVRQITTAGPIHFQSIPITTQNNVQTAEILWG